MGNIFANDHTAYGEDWLLAFLQRLFLHYFSIKADGVTMGSL